MMYEGMGLPENGKRWDRNATYKYKY